MISIPITQLSHKITMHAYQQSYNFHHGITLLNDTLLIWSHAHDNKLYNNIMEQSNVQCLYAAVMTVPYT